MFPITPTERSETNKPTPPTPTKWRILSWGAVVILFGPGWLLLGAAGMAGGPPLQAIAGALMIAGASVIALRLKNTLTVIRLLAFAFGAMIVAPFVILGVILFLVYPLASLFGNS